MTDAGRPIEVNSLGGYGAIAVVLTGLAVPAVGGVIPSVLAGENGRPLADQRSYEVHLVPSRDIDSELVRPTGQLLELPDDRYMLWVEGADRISGAAFVPTFDGTAETVKDLVFQMHPAGEVRLEPQSPPIEAHQFRLLSLESHISENVLHHEFWRRVSPEVAKTGVRMPTGGVIAALCNRQGCTALSRPTTVTAGETRTIRLSPPPERRSDLLVRLRRPEAAPTIAGNEVELVLSRADARSRPPDVVVPAYRRLHAVWYGVRPGVWQLYVQGDALWAGPVEIRLRGGTLTESSVDAIRRPMLSVGIDVPSEVRELPGKIELVRQGESEVVAEREFARSTPREIELERIVPGMMDLRLQLGPWEFDRTADLQDGEDDRVVFRPESARIAGEVTRGGEPMASVVRFLTSRRVPDSENSMETATDEAGLFEAVVFPRQLTWWVEVLPPDGLGEPYREYLERPLRDGDYLEIQVPDTRIDVKVTDRETGEPVGGARVSYSVLREARQMTERIATSTDDKGKAFITAVAFGELELSANAPGYVGSEPVRARVDEDTEPREVHIQLEPEGENARLQIELADGSPAAAARALLLDAEAATAKWSGRADERGVLEIPRRVGGGQLVVSHERSGFRMTPWIVPRPEASSIDLRLPPSGGALAVRTIRPNGTPAPHAMISLFLGGRRIPGSVMSWLDRGVPPVSDKTGLWRATYLPAGKVGILAWEVHPDLRRRVWSGELDYRMQVVQLPTAGTLDGHAPF